MVLIHEESAGVQAVGKVPRRLPEVLQGEFLVVECH